MNQFFTLNIALINYFVPNQVNYQWSHGYTGLEHLGLVDSSKEGNLEPCETVGLLHEHLGYRV